MHFTGNKKQIIIDLFAKFASITHITLKMREGCTGTPEGI